MSKPPSSPSIPGSTGLPLRSPSALRQVTDTDGIRSGSPNPRDLLQRTASTTSTRIDGFQANPSRSGTLRKKNSVSVRKRMSLSHRGSIRSLRASSLREAGMGDESEFNNVFNVPIPTSGNPTEVLAERFQAWRKLLKDLTTYFGEIQSSYEHRSKALLKVSNVINNTTAAPVFITDGGLSDATVTLRKFHKQSIAEANKARDIEEDVITQLNGLRSDLNQKIKEIKSLSGDFKNSVDREKDTTRKAIEALRDALAMAESDSSGGSGKNDPYIVRLHTERQVEKQIEEENYLHRAYLNLEGSGRELESIVVGEIQKAYNAYVGILRRETEQAQEVMNELRNGPIAMPKDLEWTNFIQHDTHFIDPALPLRKLEQIRYPGRYDPAAQEIRAGMLERKSKYLKSYTAGWYVLSATHLHEFKSADHIHTQSPVMSLPLHDQKLGSHSQPGATSHKFSLKGKQSGAMHRGHSWVFRAESYDTMMAWYDDIINLTEKTTVERNAFVKRHARNFSGGSHPVPSIISSDGLREDEADSVPYSAHAANAVNSGIVADAPAKRPEPGGRFPSDLNLERRLHEGRPQSSGSSVQSGDPFVGNSPELMQKQLVGASRIHRNDPHNETSYSARQPGYITTPAVVLHGEGLDHHNPPLASLNNTQSSAANHVPNTTFHSLNNGQPDNSFAATDGLALSGVGGVVGASALHHDIHSKQAPALNIAPLIQTDELEPPQPDSIEVTPIAMKSREEYFSRSPSTFQGRSSGEQMSNSNNSTPTKASTMDTVLTQDEVPAKPADSVQSSSAGTGADNGHMPGEFPPTPASTEG